MTKRTPWYESFFTGLYADVLGGDPHTSRAAGFRKIELLGHPPLAPFTRHSRRLIAVGTKLE